MKIQQLIPADGWYAEDNRGDRCSVVAFALVEPEDSINVIPLIAMPDGIIEEPGFPYTLKHATELGLRRPGPEPVPFNPSNSNGA